MFLRGNSTIEISHISQHQGCGADVASGEAGEALFCVAAFQFRHNDLLVLRTTIITEPPYPTGPRCVFG